MYDGVHVDSISADQTAAARSAAVDNFRSGATWLLIATDLIARGMDFAGVQTVVNYDFPHSTSDYIHRIGRTGRAGRSGARARPCWRSGPQHRRAALLARPPRTARPPPRLSLSLPPASLSSTFHALISSYNPPPHHPSPKPSASQTLPPGEAVTFYTEEDGGRVRGVAHLIKGAGGEVPEWLLTLKYDWRAHHRRNAADAAAGGSGGGGSGSRAPGRKQHSGGGGAKEHHGKRGGAPDAAAGGGGGKKAAAAGGKKRARKEEA
jgi:hypothetical protein